MAKLYLPTEYLDKPCYVFNDNYIRVYNTINSQNNVVYDIYFKDNYAVKRGTASYGSTTVCDNINTYVDDIEYRYDFWSILLTFILFLGFVSFIVIKIVRITLLGWRWA